MATFYSFWEEELESPLKVEEQTNIRNYYYLIVSIKYNIARLN